MEYVYRACLCGVLYYVLFRRGASCSDEHSLEHRTEHLKELSRALLHFVLCVEPARALSHPWLPKTYTASFVELVLSGLFCVRLLSL